MGWGRSLTPRAALALCAVTLTAMAGCGGGDDDDPGSGDVPSGAVAVIGDTEISDDALEGQVDVLARAQPSNDGKAEISTAEREQLQTQALTLLLQSEALEQEAADRGIEVSDAEVRERWETIVGNQFDSPKELRRFLGGQREQDVIAQLRLQTLADRIQQQVSEEAGGGKQGRKAVKEYQREFQKRWRERTACAEGYSASGCDG